MNIFSVKDFYTMVITILEEIMSEVVGENPSGKSNFPCIVVQSPMRLDEINGEYNPILSRFSITCEVWTKRKLDSLSLADEIDEKLRKYNFTRIGTPIDLYDENTGCHRYGGNYEVFFNALNGSLEKVK